MERVLVRVHVERVDREIVRRQVERLEYLTQGQVFAVTEDHDLLHLVAMISIGVAAGARATKAYIRALLHLALDEPEHVLLVHARRVVDMSVDLNGDGQ